MHATESCSHPMTFNALDRTGCLVREATRDEVLGWVVGQRHPKFSLVSPMSLCFDGNVRVGTFIVARERACHCPSNQPYMD